MAFDLKTAKPVRGKFDISTAKPIRDSNLTVNQEPQTFAGKSFNALKDIASYPLGLPGNPMRVYDALASGSPAESYYELMPRMEKGAAVVKSAKTEAIGNMLRDSPSDYPVARGALAATADLALDFAPFEPSSFITPAAPIAARAASSLVNLPIRSPAIVEQGVKKVMENISGDVNFPASKSGAAAIDLYERRVAAPMRDLMVEKSPPPQALPPPAGKDILNPAYETASSRISKNPATFQDVGETITEASRRRLSELKGAEKEQWGKLSSEHFEKPASLEKTRGYIESISAKGENISALDRLPPGAREAAMRTSNPELAARGMIDFGEKSKFMNIKEMPENATTPEVQNAQIQNGYSVVSKLFDISQEPTTFGRLKTLRSQLGEMIDWNTRGNELNHHLKQIYKSMTEDMGASSKAGGFEESVKSANQASKDFFRYTEKPSSQIIGKSKYPSDLVNRLIKTNSPERVDELFSEHRLTAQEKSTVQRGILDEIKRKSGDDPHKFSQLLDKYTPETRAAIFGEHADAVNSLKNTAKILDAEIAKSKVKLPAPKTYGKEDILSRDGMEIDRIFTNSKASELVDNIVKNGSPEIAELTTGVLGENGSKIVRRGIINQIVDKSKTKLPDGGYRIDANRMSSELTKMNPEFVEKMFGKDAQKINALRDSMKYFKEEMSPEYYGDTPFGLRWAKNLYSIFQGYRLPSKMFKMLENSAGAEFAESVVPRKKFGLPNFRVPPVSVSSPLPKRKEK